MPGAERSWSLNDLAGFHRGPWGFEATMGFEIIQDDRDGYGPWRVTTRQYQYKMSHKDQTSGKPRDIFRMHWHPAGVSDVTEPHLHVRLSPEYVFMQSLKTHLPVGRMSLENAIRWAIELGLSPGRDDWREVLDSTEQPHLDNRTWDADPTRPVGRHRK